MRETGFLRFNNSFLKDAEFIEDCNKVIANTMKMYDNKPQLIDNPNAKQFAYATFQINHTLLHDVILMEARAFTIKYTAKKRIEANFIKNSLHIKIQEIQDSPDEDNYKRLKNLKDCLDDLERKE